MEFELLCGMPVYADTAPAPLLMSQEQLLRFVKEFGSELILFGTDMPWENPEEQIRWMNPVIL